ncbi:MAG TPA: keto-deoxy-phosphogluconate aldolase, partial [Caulobacteraceae bacterium]
MDVRDFLTISPVVPVLIIPKAEDAVRLAEALVAGGLRVLEVTLRTPAALEAIRRITEEVPDAVVAAGTVLSA